MIKMKRTGFAPRCQLDYLLNESKNHGAGSDVIYSGNSEYMKMIQRDYCGTCGDIECEKHGKTNDLDAKRKPC